MASSSVFFLGGIMDKPETKETQENRAGAETGKDGDMTRETQTTISDVEIIKNMQAPVMPIEEIKALLANRDLIGQVRRLAEAAFLYHKIILKLKGEEP